MLDYVCCAFGLIFGRRGVRKSSHKLYGFRLLAGRVSCRSWSHTESAFMIMNMQKIRFVKEEDLSSIIISAVRAGPCVGMWLVATRWFCTERPSWFMRSPVNTGIACTNSWMHFDWTWAEPVTINSAITSVYRHLMIKCIRTHQQHHLPHNAWWLSFRFNKFRRETKAMRRPVVYHNWVN